MARSIVFMGTPAFAGPTLEALIKAGFDVKLVLTQPDRPVGRGQKLSIPPVKAIALENNIPVLQPERLKGNEEVFEAIKAAAPDAIVVVAYGQFLPKSILDLPPFGCVNVHASLLPKYRGAAPIQWAIANGESTTGVTTMLMAQKMDAGPILLQEETPILPEDTTETLSLRLSEMGGKLLVETLHRLFVGTVIPQAQDETQVTFASLIKKEDGVINWERPATEIANRIRAFSPWPGSTTVLDGKPVKVREAIALPGEGTPGEIVGLTSEGWQVGTGEGLLLIKQIQIPGCCCQPAVEAARGLRCLQIGLRLGQ